MSKAAYKIEVENGEDEKGNTIFAACYLEEMNRDVLEAVLSMIQPKGNEKPKYLQAGEKILNSCWIKKTKLANGEEVESDDEILTKDSLLVAASMQAYELVDIKRTNITKL